MKVIKKDEVQFMPYGSEFYSRIEADEYIENLKKQCRELSAALHKMYSEEEVNLLRQKISELNGDIADLVDDKKDTEAILAEIYSKGKDDKNVSNQERNQ